MRYVGQGHEIVVPVPARALAAADVGSLREAFEREYRMLFQRVIPEGAIEILSWTLTLSTPHRLPSPLAPVARAGDALPVGIRRVFDAEAEAFAEIPSTPAPISARGPGSPAPP
jgi:N-methylhydantoinase A